GCAIMAKRPRQPINHHEHDEIDCIVYDNHGRMRYHPEFHFSHGKPTTLEDKIYVAKFYEVDGRRKISFAIGKTEGYVQTLVYDMRKRGIFEIYKNLSDDEWLKLITPKNRSAQSRKR
ncbi:MAG: hypothetical protein J7559_00030, partial [Cohnella sp.]|nr:hypothetical protein [Cohnella sp.]